MNNNSRETVFERTYKQLDQQILEHAKKDVDDQEQFFAKLDSLKLQQKEIVEALLRQTQDEKHLFEEMKKTKEAFCATDELYQKAKEAWDEELLQKFHNRSLTREENIEMHKKYWIISPFDLIYWSYKD